QSVNVWVTPSRLSARATTRPPCIMALLSPRKFGKRKGESCGGSRENQGGPQVVRHAQGCATRHRIRARNRPTAATPKTDSTKSRRSPSTLVQSNRAPAVARILVSFPATRRAGRGGIEHAVRRSRGSNRSLLCGADGA